jgi:hypothetical protein
MRELKTVVSLEIIVCYGFWVLSVAVHVLFLIPAVITFVIMMRGLYIVRLIGGLAQEFKIIEKSVDRDQSIM